MSDSAHIKRCHIINFVVTNIADYDVTLRMAWLQKQNPNIFCDKSIWHWRNRTDTEDMLICLVFR
jgi:hypothetical protein